MSSKIEYAEINGPGSPVKVKLDNKQVGAIWPCVGGWRYWTNTGMTGGKIYPTLEEVKRSLEAED